MQGLERENALKAIRYLIDVDGDVDKTIIELVVNGAIRTEYFFDFNSKTNDFHENYLSNIFYYVVDYYKSYHEAITEGILRTSILSDEDLKPHEAKAVISIVNEIVAEDVVATEFPFIRDAVVNRYTTNHLAYICRNAIGAAEDSGKPVDALDLAQKDLIDLKTRVNPKRNQTHTSQMLWQFAEKKLKAFRATGKVIEPTATFGFERWDKAFGGLLPGEVTIFGGPQNSCKSTLMNRVLLHNAFQGKKVVWATRENSLDQNWNRLLALITGIPLSQINKSMFTDVDKQLLTDAMEWIISEKDRMLLIPPTDALTIQMIQNQIQLNFGSENPDIIGIDHIGRLMPSNRGYGATWENMKKVVEETKDLAEYFQCALLSPCHLNRKGQKSEGKGDIDEVQFASITEICDNAFICKPDPDHPWVAPDIDHNQLKGVPGILNCTAIRCRNQPKGYTLQLEVEPSVSMVRDCVVTTESRDEKIEQLTKREKRRG